MQYLLWKQKEEKNEEEKKLRRSRGSYEDN
jgi:hypothetical protein